MKNGMAIQELEYVLTNNQVRPMGSPTPSHRFTDMVLNGLIMVEYIYINRQVEESHSDITIK